MQKRGSAIFSNGGRALKTFLKTKSKCWKSKNKITLTLPGTKRSEQKSFCSFQTSLKIANGPSKRRACKLSRIGFATTTTSTYTRARSFGKDASFLHRERDRHPERCRQPAGCELALSSPGSRREKSRHVEPLQRSLRHAERRCGRRS